MSSRFTSMRWVLTVAIVLWPFVVQAETAYVTDMLQLEMYASKALSGKPIKRLRSGDAMEILSSEGRYAQVKLPSGQTGWVKSLYLVKEEPARSRFNRVEKDNVGLQATVTKLREQLEKYQAQVKDLEASTGSSAARQREIDAELETLRSNKTELEERLAGYRGSVPVIWLLAAIVAALGLGGWLGWFWLDRRSRARHGGFRVH